MNNFKEQIIKDFIKGKSVNSIALNNGISMDHVYKILCEDSKDKYKERKTIN